jgi:hypothetical protein
MGNWFILDGIIYLHYGGRSSFCGGRCRHLAIILDS